MLCLLARRHALRHGDLGILVLVASRVGVVALQHLREIGFGLRLGDTENLRTSVMPKRALVTQGVDGVAVFFLSLEGGSGSGDARRSSVSPSIGVVGAGAMGVTGETGGTLYLGRFLKPLPFLCPAIPGNRSCTRSSASRACIAALLFGPRHSCCGRWSALLLHSISRRSRRLVLPAASDRSDVPLFAAASSGPFPPTSIAQAPEVADSPPCQNLSLFVCRSREVSPSKRPGSLIGSRGGSAMGGASL